MLRFLLGLMLFGISGCSLDWSADQATSSDTSPGRGASDMHARDAASPIDAGDVSESSNPEMGGDAAAGPDDPSKPMATLDLSCTQGRLTTSVVTRASTTTSGDDMRGSCGGSNAPETAYAWTAPEDDFYKFTTANSSFDTVLYLNERDCTGAEVECNDDVGGSPTASFVRRAAKGSTWVVVADAKAGDSGALELLVEPVGCPRIDLDTPILPVQHSTTNQPDNHAGSCGGQGAGDRAYRFTAAIGGLYQFAAQRRDGIFAPAIYLEDGPVCGGKTLQCSQSADGLPQVTRFLQAGQSVVAIVDGAKSGSSGSFSLDVSRLQDSCTDGVLANGTYMLPKSGKHRMTTGCGAASVWWLGRTDPKEIRRFPDLSLTFESAEKTPQCPPPTCNIMIDAGFPFFASVTEGMCAGAEVSCQPSTPGAANRHKAKVVAPKTDKRPYTLTIDRELPDYQGGAVMQEASTDDVQISIECAGVC